MARRVVGYEVFRIWYEGNEYHEEVVARFEAAERQAALDLLFVVGNMRPIMEGEPDEPDWSELRAEGDAWLERNAKGEFDRYDYE